MGIKILFTSFLLSFFGGENLFFSPEQINSHLVSYSEEERVDVAKDLDLVRDICLGDLWQRDPSRAPIYLATAGGPGSRKSTILERFMERNPEFSRAAYIDPDRRGLRFMTHTYYQHSHSALATAQHEDYAMASKAAYEKWRGASNYIALTLMEEAFYQRRDVAHGTTLTGGHVPAFLPALKEAGYEIVLLLCSCKDDFREAAIRYRNEEQKFYQSTPEDAVSKGKFFPLRMESYFANANKLHLFWSDDLFIPETEVARLENGKLEILDQTGYQKFINKFKADRATLQQEGDSIPSWEELLQLYQFGRNW